ncbi:MAG: XRE family transcriptional regulator [Bacillota bacterium]|nr:XRE family transcriptional regulator [Bacillota bacterium]
MGYKERVVTLLADRIRKQRQNKKWSQKDLAQKLNLTQQAIARWEGSKTNPDSEMLIQLSKLFNCSVDYLLGQTDDPNNRELPDTVAPYLPEGFDELSPEARKEVLDFIDYVMVKYAKEKKE